MRWMDYPTSMTSKSTYKLSMLIIFTALCIASNYALISLPQVKIMDFIVFLGGFFLGSAYGAAIGILSWIIYGAINPYGFVPQIWLATMLSESIYGLLGGFISGKLSKNDINSSYFSLGIFFGVLGFISTFIYDLITNIVFAVTFDVPILVAIFMGTPYTLLHQFCNTALFGLGFIPTVTILEKLMGGVWFGILEK